MTKRAALFLFCLGITTSLHAASADLVLVLLDSDKTTVTTGERFTVRMRVRNAGPDAALNIAAGIFLSHDSSGFPLEIQAPAGWVCVRLGDIVRCDITSFPANAEAEFKVTAFAPPRTQTFPYDIRAAISPDPFSLPIGSPQKPHVPDPNLNNNEKAIDLKLVAATNRADLAVTASASGNPVPRETAATVTFNVTNNGPDSVTNLVQIVSGFSGNSSVFVPFSLVGDGWSCTSLSEHKDFFVCTRAFLASGDTTSLRLQFTTPFEELKLQFFSRVFAEKSTDEQRPNDSASATVNVGSADEWTQFLLPITSTNVPGFGGSLWKTDITILSNRLELDYEPTRCHTRQEFLCFRITPNKPLDFREAAHVWPDSTAQFVYVRKLEEPFIHLNSRVYDVSRAIETAGTEIPIPRGRDFSGTGITLLNIPVRPEYRYTLRIYDADGHAGEHVGIFVYVDDQDVPRLARHVPLALQGQQRQLRTALLPALPAMTQLDLGSVMSLDNARTLRIEIHPTFGTRVWGLVSVTNNITQQVTIISPQ